MNGDESGIDCGGSCSLICSAESLNPIMRSDPRIFEIYPGVYSVVAYVENQNVDGRATDVPYTFKFYTSNGKLIYERQGKSSLLRSSVTAIFEGNITIKGERPTKAVLELPPSISWIKDTKEYPELKIEHSSILNGDVAPRIEATIKNNSIEDVKNLEIVASVFDGKDNVVAASRTFIELLRKGQETSVFFTWPIPFTLATRSCDKPSETLLLIDRSGSMTSLGKNPPEPLTSVKEAAKYFVSLLRDGDKAGLISFATLASSPSDMSLTSDFGAVQKAIDNIKIFTDTTQYTNISDAINTALAEFSIDKDINGDSDNRKVVIVLTDGVPNRPGDPTVSKNEQARLNGEVGQADIAYAEADALRFSAEAKKEGIELFSIGLGKDIHKEFLDKLATTPENSFVAPAISDLKNIYKSISSSICKEVPARIEMNYKFND
jgi:hypothetical protein